MVSLKVMTSWDYRSAGNHRSLDLLNVGVWGPTPQAPTARVAGSQRRGITGFHLPEPTDSKATKEFNSELEPWGSDAVRTGASGP